MHSHFDSLSSYFLAFQFEFWEKNRNQKTNTNKQEIGTLLLFSIAIEGEEINGDTMSESQCVPILFPVRSSDFVQQDREKKIDDADFLYSRTAIGFPRFFFPKFLVWFRSWFPASCSNFVSVFPPPTRSDLPFRRLTKINILWAPYICGPCSGEQVEPALGRHCFWARLELV